jgi:NAD+ synthase (glutamine-hydrolysing)
MRAVTVGEDRGMARLPFDNIYRHGFVRVAAAVPAMQVTDVARNVAETLALAERASADHVAVVVFPELGLVGSTAWRGCATRRPTSSR